MVLKKPIFDQKGGQNFKKSKKVPLDILEIHVASKFGPILMKIGACRCCDNKQMTDISYRELNSQNSIKPSNTLNNSP